MDKNAIKIIDGFKGRKLVVIGDIILDRYISGEVSRISPEAPIPVLRERSREERLGGAAYVASLLKALGAEAELFGIIGDDVAGEAVLHLADKQGIDTAGVVKTSARPTTLKTRLVASRQQMLRLDREDCSAVDNSLLVSVINAAGEEAAVAGALILSDYDKGLFRGGKWSSLIKTWRAAGKPVLADFKPGNADLFRGITVATPNQKEAAQVVGGEIADQASLEQAGAKLLEVTAAEGMLITRGSQGMSLFQAKDETMHISTKAREVFDVTGAGDAVITVMALALAGGADLRLAARLANYAGGVVVGKLGVASISGDELKTAARGDG